MQFSLRQAETLDDAENMRLVRNSCREFMTRSPLEISREDQIEWFTSLDRDSIQPFIGFAGSRLAPMAYGLVRKIDGEWFLSGGLLPDWRGAGYGKMLFCGLTAHVHAKRANAYLEVRASNDRAINLYRSLGYGAFMVSNDRSVIFMRKDFR